jgi:hypothetical protein
MAFSTCDPALCRDARGVAFYANRPREVLRRNETCRVTSTPSRGQPRSVDSLRWPPLFNAYSRLDSIERVTGLIMTQMLPLADEKRLGVYAPFESGLCGA